MNSVDVDKRAGTCENVAWAFLLLPLLSSLVLLAVQIWGRSQLKEFEISSSGRSPRSAYTWAPLCNLYHRQERAAHLTAARSQGPEIVVLTGIGWGRCYLPNSGSHRNHKWDKVRLRRLQIRPEAGSPRQREVAGRGWLQRPLWQHSRGTAVVQQQETEAETHYKEQCKHVSTTPSYSIAARLFPSSPTPSG